MLKFGTQFILLCLFLILSSTQAFAGATPGEISIPDPPIGSEFEYCIEEIWPEHGVDHLTDESFYRECRVATCYSQIENGFEVAYYRMVLGCSEWVLDVIETMRYQLEERERRLLEERRMEIERRRIEEGIL